MLSPQYWKYPTVLMLFPHVLNTLHSTEGIPHCTDLILHCTEQPPKYLRYPSQYSSYLPRVLPLCPSQYLLNTLHSTDVVPQYWCYPLHVLRLSPTVLKLTPTVLSKLYKTEAIPHSTDLIPPMYWTTSNVLNNLQCTESLHSTELTLYGVEFEFATVNWICRSEF